MPSRSNKEERKVRSFGAPINPPLLGPNKQEREPSAPRPPPELTAEEIRRNRNARERPDNRYAAPKDEVRVEGKPTDALPVFGIGRTMRERNRLMQEETDAQSAGNRREDDQG